MIRIAPAALAALEHQPDAALGGAPGSEDPAQTQASLDENIYPPTTSSTSHCSQRLQSAAATRGRRGCLHGVPPLVICQAMQANAKPTAAPGDGAPASEDPALIQISNQHRKRGQARSEEPAPPKLNNQRNTHAMPVRAHNGCRAVP